jgi:hypothetical protein
MFQPSGVGAQITDLFLNEARHKKNLSTFVLNTSSSMVIPFVSLKTMSLPSQGPESHEFPLPIILGFPVRNCC